MSLRFLYLILGRVLSWLVLTRAVRTDTAPGCSKPSWPRWSPQTGLVITVCHFPPGTSKWNKIEHRLFSHITHNWRGRPLTSHEVVINTIATTTRTGLIVHAELDTGRYPTGVKITDEQLATLRSPATTGTATGTTPCPVPTIPHRPRRAPRAHPPARRDSTGWAHPALTGMPTQDLDQLTSELALPHQAHREAEPPIRRGGP